MRWADKDGDGKVFFSFLAYLRLASLFGKVFFFSFLASRLASLFGKVFFLSFLASRLASLFGKVFFLLFFSFKTCKLVWQVTQFFEGGAEGILVNDVSQRQRNSHKVNKYQFIQRRIKSIQSKSRQIWEQS